MLILPGGRTRGSLVSTGQGDGPAKAMYERLGFVRVEDTEVVQGLWVTRYERKQ